MRVWDEFSEFLPENRVPTSADFNTYPIRIFSLFLTLFSCEVNSYKFEADFGGKLFGSIYRPINLSDNSVEELNLGKDNMT